MAKRFSKFLEETKTQLHHYKVRLIETKDYFLSIGRNFIALTLLFGVLFIIFLMVLTKLESLDFYSDGLEKLLSTSQNIFVGSMAFSVSIGILTVNIRKWLDDRIKDLNIEIGGVDKDMDAESESKFNQYLDSSKADDEKKHILEIKTIFRSKVDSYRTKELLLGSKRQEKRKKLNEKYFRILNVCIFSLICSLICLISIACKNIFNIKLDYYCLPESTDSIITCLHALIDSIINCLPVFIDSIIIIIAILIVAIISRASLWILQLINFPLEYQAVYDSRVKHKKQYLSRLDDDLSALRSA
jgi:hypothetical protein